MDNRKLNTLSKKLITDGKNYMDSFRKNVFMYLEDKNITIKKLSKKSKLSESTINSFLYGNSSDIMLGTAIKLSKALRVSIDELVGADTIDKYTKEALAIYRNVPEHSQYLIRYFIKHQREIYENKSKKENIISLLKPQCKNGSLLTTNVVEPLNIGEIPKTLNQKAYLGIKIPCEHYMPYYAPGDIILVSSDRVALNNERFVITHAGKIYIVIKKMYIENGKKSRKIVSLMNENFSISEDYIDDIIGYIVGFLNPDLTFGIR